MKLKRVLLVLFCYFLIYMYREDRKRYDTEDTVTNDIQPGSAVPEKTTDIPVSPQTEYTHSERQYPGTDKETDSLEKKYNRDRLDKEPRETLDADREFYEGYYSP